MKLVYCCHAVIDQTDEPDWVGKLVTHPLLVRERWAVYRPCLGFVEQLQSSATMLAAMSRTVALSSDACATLRIDPQLLEPLGSVLPRLERADEGPTLDVAFKRLYAVLRSDIVLVDMNAPDHGCRSQEVMYAYLSVIPVVGIAHRFILSPALAGLVGTVLFPRTSDEIVRQVLAFDHKVTATLQYYRDAHSAARETLDRPTEQQAADSSATTEPVDGDEDKSVGSVL